MIAEMFFRVAERQCVKGTIMMGRGLRPLDATEPHIEKILENQRPPHCLDRGDCVYMRRSRDFATVGLRYDEGYINTVVVDGNFEMRDLLWIGVLQQRHNKWVAVKGNIFSDLSDEQVAANYWSGKGTEVPDWEWVSKSALVVDVDSEPTRIRPPSHFLNVINRILSGKL